MTMLDIVKSEVKTGIYAPIAGDVYNDSHRFSPVQCYHRSSLGATALTSRFRAMGRAPAGRQGAAGYMPVQYAGRRSPVPVRRCSAAITGWFRTVGRTSAGHSKVAG
jgi:hypothetical protein